MAKKQPKLLPASAEVRDFIRKFLQSSEEPLTASIIAKQAAPSSRLPLGLVTEVLEEEVETGTLFLVPPKTAKGKPRYWDRDVSALAGVAVCESAVQAIEPFTAKELGKQLDLPVKLPEADITVLLESLVESGTVFPIPAKTAKSPPRYWNRNVLDWGRQQVTDLLRNKGPQTQVQLKKVLKGLNQDQQNSLLQQGIAARKIWRHPICGKIKKELFGNGPASPAPYLQEPGKQISQVVSKLIAADVSAVEIRRALVEMIEAAGISFSNKIDSGTKQESRGESTPSEVDLPALMRQIEPGADRGALVILRDLRHLARMEKKRFDDQVLSWASRGRISLHRHDYPASLTDGEREELVRDTNGTYYVGIALRRHEDSGDVNSPNEHATPAS